MNPDEREGNSIALCVKAFLESKSYLLGNLWGVTLITPPIFCTATLCNSILFVCVDKKHLADRS